MVMLHIKSKRNDACSNIGAITLPIDTPSTLGSGGLTGRKCFMEVVMLHNKLKLMVCRAPGRQLFCPYTHLDPWGGVKSSNIFFFSEYGLLHIKFKGKKLRQTCKLKL